MCPAARSSWDGAYEPLPPFVLRSLSGVACVLGKWDQKVHAVLYSISRSRLTFQRSRMLACFVHL